MHRSTSTRLAFCAATLLAVADGRSAEGAAPPSGSVQQVTVRAVTRFDFDGTKLDAADRARVLADVGKMKDVAWQTVTATGYTDSIGATRYNERLSARRADAVKTYLVGKGLDASMIETAGKGAASPIADNGSATGRARNRRTEIEFRGVRQTAP